MTPLMLAIKAGNVEIITVMLDLGCDIHSEAKREKSLIVWAIENEYTALLKVATCNECIMESAAPSLLLTPYLYKLTLSYKLYFS